MYAKSDDHSDRNEFKMWMKLIEDAISINNMTFSLLMKIVIFITIAMFYINKNVYLLLYPLF